MKILMIHNFYQSSSPSGEDIVFKSEIELLKKNGVDVIVYERHNDEIKNHGRLNKLILPLKLVWSWETYFEIKNIIKKEKPDIAHFHNIWYLISPSAYYACKEMGIPVIQTLHNFRMFCCNGLLLRDNKVCEECIDGKNNKLIFIKNAIKYGCYRNSKVYSLPIAITQYFHSVKKTWIESVDMYIVLTEFSKKKFVEFGIPGEKIYIKPNFLPNAPEPNFSFGDYAIFVGRLSKEKGVDLLIKTFEKLSPDLRNNLVLKIVGDGPLRTYLENLVKNENIKGIEFLGKQNREKVIELIKNASFLILPSVWYEMFPLVTLEAFACGKPVIASKIGALPDIVEDGKTGLLFTPGNEDDLVKKIKFLWNNKEMCVEMGKNARKVFDEKYSERRNFKLLVELYSNLLKKGGKHNV